MADARERHIEAAMVACPRCKRAVGQACIERYCKNGYRNCDYAICARWRETVEPHMERSVNARQQRQIGVQP